MSSNSSRDFVLRSKFCLQRIIRICFPVDWLHKDSWLRIQTPWRNLPTQFNNCHYNTTFLQQILSDFRACKYAIKNHIKKMIWRDNLFSSPCFLLHCKFFEFLVVNCVDFLSTLRARLRTSSKLHTWSQRWHFFGI